MKTNGAKIGIMCVLVGIVLLGAYMSGVLVDSSASGLNEIPGLGTRATEKVRIVPVTGRSATLTAGSTTSLLFNITNVYGYNISGASWDLSGVSKAATPSGISYTLDPMASASFNLNASGDGSYFLGYLNITVSSGVTGADWDPCVLEAFVGRALTDSITLTVTVGTSHAVTLSLSMGMSPSITAIAGRPCSALVVITNTGNSRDTYSLSATGQGIWDVDFIVDAGIWSSFDVSRGIFDEAMSGLDTALDSWVAEKETVGDWDGFEDDITLAGQSITEITVSAGAMRTFLVQIISPTTATVGETKTITIKAESQTDSQAFDTLDITVEIGAASLGYAVSLSATSTVEDIGPGETVSFDVTITGGTVAESVLIAVGTECPLAFGWDVVVTDASGTEILEPGVLDDTGIGGFRGTDSDLTFSNTNMRSAVLDIPADGSIMITVEITAPDKLSAVPGMTYGTVISAVVVQDNTRGDILSIGMDTGDDFTGREDKGPVTTFALLGLTTMTLILLGAAILVAGLILVYWYYYVRA